MTTYRAALLAGRRALAAEGVDHPALDARLLLAAAAGLETSALIARDGEMLPPLANTSFNSYLERRLGGEPVARILGEKEFWGLPFLVNGATLVPRPDTETLVEAILAEISRRGLPPDLRICDLGTGSGAIVVALMTELPEASGVATDISQATLDVARRNAERLGVAPRITFAMQDFAEGPTERFDVLVSNPPYVESGGIAGLPAEVRNHDPPVALDGGPDGLAAYRIIVGRAPDRLKQGGFLALEVGSGQRAAVEGLCEASGLRDVMATRDLAGVERVVVAAAQAKVS